MNKKEIGRKDLSSILIYMNWNTWSFHVWEWDSFYKVGETEFFPVIVSVDIKNSSWSKIPKERK